ncbi:hypothetical protein J4221_05530 [Candidatus Pacearchaeota archaeon]|nr:hypothetical protein [Candidatus Pacearchaeota archaeon]
MKYKVILFLLSIIFTFGVISVSIISYDLCSFSQTTTYPLNHSGTYLERYNITLFKEYALENSYRMYICRGNKVGVLSNVYGEERYNCGYKMVVDKGVPTKKLIDNAAFQLNEEEFEIKEEGFFCEIPFNN